MPELIVRVAGRQAPGVASALAGLFLLAALASCGSCGGDASSREPESASGPAREAASAADLHWQDPIEVATGDAYAGPWRMNESKFHYVDDPTVDLTAGGSVAIAWVDNRRQNVFFQRYDAGGRPVLEEPENVSKSPAVFSWLPQVKISGDGQEVFVLWQEIVFSGGTHGGEIFFARSTDGGRSFEAPQNLSESREGDGKGRLTRKLWHNGSLDLALGPGGAIYAAWTEYEGRLWFRRSEDGGEHFTAPVRVAGSGEVPARAPDLAVGPEGAVYLAWTVGEDPAADIRFAAAEEGRSFGEPRVLFESEGHGDAPGLAADRRGDVHLAYAESPAGRFEPSQILYARLRDGERADLEPRRIAGPEKDGVESTGFPAVSVGSEDDVFVLWERFPERGQRPRGLGFALSSDRGQSFTSPSVVPGTADPALGTSGGLQGLLMQKLAVNDAGAIAVANSRFAADEASSIRLIRGRRAP